MTKHFLHAVDELKRDVLTMGGLVETATARATSSFLEGDERMTASVIDGDGEVNAMELRIEEECLKLLALYGPTAKDLRFIVGVFKISNDLERVGDLAVHIAERARARARSGRDYRESMKELRDMSDRVRAMLTRALDSFLSEDPARGREVLAMDDGVDELLEVIYDQQKVAVRAQGADFEDAIRVLSTAKFLERIADHSTNIVEDVIYMATGDVIKHLH